MRNANARRLGQRLDALSKRGTDKAGRPVLTSDEKRRRLVHLHLKAKTGRAPTSEEVRQAIDDGLLLHIAAEYCAARGDTSGAARWRALAEEREAEIAARTATTPSEHVGEPTSTGAEPGPDDDTTDEGVPTS